MLFVIPVIAFLIAGNDTRDQADCRHDVRIEYAAPSAADYRRECIVGDRAVEGGLADQLTEPLSPLHPRLSAADLYVGPGGQVSATSGIYPHDAIFGRRERTWRPRER